MQCSIQTSPQYAELLGDQELTALLTSEAELEALVAVEIALANAQAQLGLIPSGTGEHLQVALKSFKLDLKAMSDGIASSGVPVPALLAQLRQALPDEQARWLHWGATSQDIVDCATVIQLKDCLALLESRLSALIDHLQNQSSASAKQLMAGRTRTQLATPITLGLRIARWAQPLISLEAELPKIKSRALKIQLGGAVGANTAVAPLGPAISQLMAAELNLNNASPWHTDRTALVAVSSWLTQLSSALAKMGKDLMIQSRSEIAELSAGVAGGSSTMPQKANPVQSEMLVTMNTLVQALHSGMMAAASPIEERDGASWSVEWVLLPQILTSVGCALRHGVSLSKSLNPNIERMSGIVIDNPQLMAEAASFALAAHMPRADAQALVKKAATSGQPLAKALADLSDAAIDWHTALNPESVIQSCSQTAELIFSNRDKA